MQSIRIALTLFALSAVAIAAPITGTVVNKTTGKPAAGADVVLSRMTEGLPEAARTKTDIEGHFSLDAPASTSQAPDLLRVEYEGVQYPHFMPPGEQSATIEVYDAAKQLDAITGSADIIAFETTSDNKLSVIETYVVRNDSKPPRTLMSDKTFEVYLPDGAHVEGAAAGRPGGMPVNSAPVPEQEKNRYAFIYPLRPGETLFRINYTMPYSGSASFTPKLTMAMDNFVVMLPKSMKLDAKSSGFSEAPDENGMHVAVVKAVQPGDHVAFAISGTGSIPKAANIGGSDSNGEQNDSGDPAARSGPGGGIGAPIQAPDALDKYKWWIFGAVVLAMIGGAGYIMGRPAAPAVVSAAEAAPQRRRALLLEALKEEIFRLESERASGAISEGEYAQAKAALDLVLKRALKNNSEAASA